MGSLIFLLSLLIIAIIGRVDCQIEVSTLSVNTLCAGVESNSGFTPNYPVVYGCNIDVTLSLTITFTDAPPGDDTCLPQYVNTPPTNQLSFSYSVDDSIDFSYVVKVTSTGVVADSVHYLQIPTCSDLAQAYPFYIHFLGTPTVTNIIGTKTPFNQYCNQTATSSNTYSFTSCYNAGGPAITVIGTNLDINAGLKGVIASGLQRACFKAASPNSASPPSWNAGAGTINTASSVVFAVQSRTVALGSVSTADFPGYTSYATGTACTIKTYQGLTSTSFSLSWFTATTTFTSLTATSGICQSSGNNLTNCLQIGSNGAQAITFTGTNFGPDDVPISIYGTNDICTTDTLTRIPGQNKATCILKASSGTVTTPRPFITALGTSSTGVRGPSFSYGLTVISGITCASCNCKGSCDYNGDGASDSLCGCTVTAGTPIGTITLQGSNFLASAAYDACSGNYQSTDGLTATCTAVTGETNTTRPVGATSALLAFKTNSFFEAPTITTPVTWTSSSGGTNYFDVVVTVTAKVSGRAWVRLASSSYTPTEEAVKDGSGGNFICNASSVAVVASIPKSVTLTSCAAVAGYKAFVYIDQDVAGSTESGYFGSVASSTTTVTLPTVVTSITSSACLGQCTVDGNQYLCGCPTSSAFSITVRGSWSSTPTDDKLCGSGITPTTGSDGDGQYYQCTFGGTAAVGGSVTSSNKGSGNRIYFITNFIANPPTISSTATWNSTSNDYSFTVTFTAQRTGRYTIAIISSAANTANDFTVTSGFSLDYGLHGGILCQTTGTVTSNVQLSKQISGCPQTVQGGYAKVYVEGNVTSYGAGAVTGYVETSSTAIALPVVVYEITAYSGCQATCSGHPCGCNSDGSTPLIRVSAYNLDATPSDSLCAVDTLQYNPGDGYYNCTLKGGTVGTSATSSNQGQTLLKTVDYWTNSFNTVPTLGTVAYTGDSTNDLYSVTFSFKPSVAGLYAAALVTSAEDSSWSYTNTRSGTGTNCKLALTSVTTSGATPTLQNCSMTSGTTYYVHVYVEGSSQSSATGVNTKIATAVTLPPVVTSITASGSTSCTQCSAASGKSTNSLCGCPLKGGATITINGKNLNGKVENTLCATATTSSSDSSFSCTLAESITVPTSNKASFSGVTTTYGDASVNYVTNDFSSQPSFANANDPSSTSDYIVTFSISFATKVTGKSWATAFASSTNDFNATAAQIKSNTGIPAGVSTCRATNTGSSVTSFTFTCGNGTSSDAFAMTQGWYIRVFVYSEGPSDASTDYYGSVSTVAAVPVCHPDCATCSRATVIGYCLSCAATVNGVSSGYHLETYNGLKYCCLAECATCTPRITPTPVYSTLNAFSCASCYYNASANSTMKDHLSRDGKLPTYCCHGSCSQCNGNSFTQCTSCGGYNSNTLYNGQCKNGTVEIHGDPHFHGYLDQDYTITGRPSAVYSIITDPWLQYNTRFIWYGDVYHGFDPTTNKPYDANVTYIGEIGLKFNWGDHEDRVHITVAGFAVALNGRLLEDNAARFGDGCSITRGKKYIEVETKKFRVRFFLAGSRKHPFINQRVELLQWGAIKSHGLLGQTWQRDSDHGLNRNAIWEGHQGGVDFQFRTASFLDGHLWDYEIQENDVFGDHFKYNQYNFPPK